MRQMLSFDGPVSMMTVRKQLDMRIFAESVIDVPQRASVSLSNIYQRVRDIHLHRR